MDKKFLLVSFIVMIGSANHGPAKELTSKCVLNTSERRSVPPWFQHAQQETVLYSFDFEEPLGGDFVGVDGTHVGVKWHRDEYMAYEGLSWWCGESMENGLRGYGDWWYQVLDTPHDQPIDLNGTTNPVLTMKVRWSCESSNGECPPDYDGWTVWISTNSGHSFEKWLEPIGGYSGLCDTSWAYQFHGQYVTGGVPVHNDSSDGWVDQEFLLDNYIGQQIVLRVAFLSDYCWSTFDIPGSEHGINPEVYGILIDNFSVDDGTTRLFFDNADDQVHLIPSQITRGNHWILTETDSYSETHSWWIDADDLSIPTNYLETPWLTIPEGLYAELNYWMHADMPDFDGDHNDLLDDYYMVHITTDGEHWTQMHYHWPRQSEGFSDTTGYYENCYFETWWGQVGPWNNYNGSLKIYAFVEPGMPVKIRWSTWADANDDCGNGSGFFLDDVTIVAVRPPQLHPSIDRIDVGFPTSALLAVPVIFSISCPYSDCTVLLEWCTKNLTTECQHFPLWITENTRYTCDWIPTDAGEFFISAYVHDLFTELIDSCSVGPIPVESMGNGILGHDGRLANYLFAFEPGDGPAVKFTPPHEIYPFTLKQASFLFGHTPGAFRLHVFEAGTDTTPGTGLISPFEVVVDSSELSPNWKNVDLSSFAELENVKSDFWLFAEFLQDSELFLMGNIAHDSPSHSYIYQAGEWVGPVEFDYMIRVRAEWYGKGDVNANGSINVFDIVRIVNMILNLYSPDEGEFWRADFNSDSEVNILDIVSIINVILGIGGCET